MNGRTTITLDAADAAVILGNAADAVGLAELPDFLDDWLHDSDIATSNHRFTRGPFTAGASDTAHASWLSGIR